MYVIIVLLLFLLFFAVYTHYLTQCHQRRSQEGYREIKEAYKRVIKRHRLSISKVHRFGNRLIAIDRVLGKLVLIVYKDGVTWEKCFRLDEIMFCHILKTTDKVSGDIQKVKMKLTFRNNNATVNFPFFDETLDNRSDLGRRLKKSKHWKREIQVQLSARTLRSPLTTVNDISYI